MSNQDEDGVRVTEGSLHIAKNEKNIIKTTKVVQERKNRMKSDHNHSNYV